MNKNSLLKALLLFCAAILVLSVTLGLKQVIGLPGYQFDDAGKYSSGDAEIAGPVKNLDIDWLSGAVHIAYHSGNSVLLSESSNKAIGADLRMRWRLDGDTLRVRFAKAGLRSYGNQEKELTVTLPEGLVLREAAIGATSGNLDIPALEADSLRLEVTSGDVSAAVKVRKLSSDASSGNLSLQLLGAAETIGAVSTSGSIDVEAPGADRVRLSSTSGAIRAALEYADEFDASSTSGNILVALGSLNKGALESSSGGIRAEIGALGELKIDSTSGNVELLLPEHPGFRAEVDSTSGRFEYSLPLTRKGDDYVCGDGSGSVDIETTSGDVRISALPQ